MLEHVIDKRPQADRILVAELFGEACHHAKWRDLTAAEEGAAVAGLRELAGGRADLLAEVAGLLEGARKGEPDEPLAPPGRRLVPQGRGRPGGDPGLDRRGAPRGGAGGPPRGSRRSPVACTAGAQFYINAVNGVITLIRAGEALAPAGGKSLPPPVAGRCSMTSERDTGE